MDWLYDVPHPADVISDPELLRRVKELRLFPFLERAAEIAEEAAKFRKMSFQERVDRLFEFIRAGEDFLNRNPTIREVYDRYKAESEAAWQRAHRDLIERHLRQTDTVPQSD